MCSFRPRCRLHWPHSLIWSLALVSCVPAGGRVHLVQPAAPHHLHLLQLVKEARMGIAGDGLRRQAETSLYRGEVMPWQDHLSAVEELPGWLEDVRNKTDQLKQAARADRAALPRRAGVGLRLRDDWKVTGMEEGGPAAESDCIKIGDILRGIDGVPIDGLDFEDAALLLSGPAGSEVTLSFERQKSNEMFEISLCRRRVPREDDVTDNSLSEEIDPDPQQAKGMFGVGLTLGEGLEVIAVDAVLTRGANVMVGDRVVSVNGVRVRGMPAKRAARLLGGRLGTSASLLLTRKRRLIALTLPRMPSPTTVQPSPSPPPYNTVTGLGMKTEKTSSHKFGGLKDLSGLLGSFLGKMGGKLK